MYKLYKGKTPSFLMIFVTALVLIVIGMVTPGCGAQKPEEGTSFEPSQILVWAQGHDATFLDPGYGYTGEDIDAIYQMFETLVKYEFTDQGIVYHPLLATAWSPSEDGKEWTFKLREGVLFHDGTPFNADAVVFSFKRLIDPNHPYYMEDRWSYFVDLMGDFFEDVIAEDEFTVKIILRRPFAPILTYFGYYSQSIVSPAAVQKYGEDFFKHPVGTGPFKLKEWLKDDRIVLVPFEDYWGEKPKIQEVVFRVVPEISTRLAELETGGAHIYSTPTPEQMGKIRGNPDLKIITQDTPVLSYVAINHSKPPLNNALVRRAIAHGVNWDKMVEVVWGELGERAVTALPKGVLGFHDGLKPYEYDPELAKALLRQAGISEGTKITMIAPNASRWSHPDPITGLEMVQADLKKIGLELEPRPMDMGAMSAAITAGDYGLSFEGWMDVPEPNNFLNTMAVAYGEAGWFYQIPELSELAVQAASTYDEDNRVSIYRRMQEIMHEQVTLIPVAYGRSAFALDADLEGVVVSADGYIPLSQVYFKR